MQFYDYPEQPASTATPDECEGIARALKANPAFTDFGPFSLEPYVGFNMSTAPPSGAAASSQRLVAEAFPELAPSLASDLGARLASRQPGSFRLNCPWDRWDIAFTGPDEPKAVGYVALPPPANSSDGQWLLVTGEIYLGLAPEPGETDALFRMDEFACLFERAPNGWTLKTCAPTSLLRPVRPAPAAL
ncbi:MAG: hypothetical protein ACOYM5_15075 [Caulobacter sp.]